MNKAVHSIYIGLLTTTVIVVTAYLFYTGYRYYSTPIEERFYMDNHDWFKPSGLFGHGLGIVGTLMILFGVVIYILRKRYNFLASFIRLKYLLEFHIFLCTLGPILILFHTAFKFGGIVSIAFWSMVVVVLSGVIGRFIYIQIPRTIEGRELTLNEVKGLKTSLTDRLKTEVGSNEEIARLIEKFIDSEDKKRILSQVKSTMKKAGGLNMNYRSILKMMNEEISLSGRIKRLQTMQRLFKYWHVAHLPFALIMLIIVILHVGVTLAFGYTWIF